MDRYVDRVGTRLTDVTYDYENQGAMALDKHCVWNGEAAIITEIFYGRGETVIQLDCEKVIPVLPFPETVKAVSSRKKKATIAVVTIPAKEEQEVKKEVAAEVAPTKKPASKKTAKKKAEKKPTKVTKMKKPTKKSDAA